MSEPEATTEPAAAAPAGLIAGYEAGPFTARPAGPEHHVREVLADAEPRGERLRRRGVQPGSCRSAAETLEVAVTIREPGRGARLAPFSERRERER